MLALLPERAMADHDLGAVGLAKRADGIGGDGKIGRRPAATATPKGSTPVLAADKRLKQYGAVDAYLVLLWIEAWSDEEVVRPWARLFPPRDKMRRPLEVSDDWVKGHLLNAAWIKRAHERLGSLSWFMKCLKEPLARLANHQDQASGAFFEARFKSIAVLDDGSLLATCAYIDLNPVAAGIASTPEASAHTSIKSASITWRRRGEPRTRRGPARAVRWRRSRRPAWRRSTGSAPSRTGAGSIRPGRG